ncbi:diphthamide biosynthesis protein 2 [Nematocida displodere]|uniref:Diphthamide biosynthesis protein 2 n=1 Tax=Nematocida displodere TaxID=1805483 RepID=A0A177EIZ7_9MICR|nr:diphthamide biosynthesis protein 2 [Nematocida displodere]
MKYFKNHNVELILEDGFIEGLEEKTELKVGIQVHKNQIETGEEIRNLVIRKHSSPSCAMDCVVLADSDRCCVDWVAVMHSSVEYIIKASFSCPLLNTKRSPKITEKYRVAQFTRNMVYTPEPITTHRNKELETFLHAYSFLLAADSSYLSAQEQMVQYFQQVLGIEIELWTYDAQTTATTIVLVISENHGFIDYFKDSTNAIVFKQHETTSPNTICRIVREHSEAVEGSRAAKLISKLAVGDEIKKAGRIGIVFTSGDHMELVNTISKYLDLNGKKFYHFYINGLKPEKLGNFIGIDLFVVIQCPFSSFRFERNIIAVRPYDLVLAFSAAWNGEYTTRLEVAQTAISEEILLTEKSEKSGKSGKSGVLETTLETALEIKSSYNLLKVEPGQVCTKEQAKRYFQTGEYLKKIEGIIVPEKAEKPPSTDLHQGYSGIPTDYTK